MYCFWNTIYVSLDKREQGSYLVDNIYLFLLFPLFPSLIIALIFAGGDSNHKLGNRYI